MIENGNSFLRCPKCSERIKDDYNNVVIPNPPILKSTVFYFKHCEWCNILILYLVENSPFSSQGEGMITYIDESLMTDIRKKAQLFYPPKIIKVLHPEIPKDFSDDYYEARKVLDVSPKSSAALSRRCLQKLLREKGKIKPKDLSNEIQQILDSQQLPEYLSKAIDAIRNIGNFATHPIKSIDTGQIAEVEYGEAQWTLDVLEKLFDFYIVQPIELERKRKCLNEKLKQHGKPEMK